MVISMVHCPNCLRKLPKECVCNISNDEKIYRFAVQAYREAQLIRQILRGEKPKVKVYLMQECIEENILEVKLIPIDCDVNIKRRNDFDVSVIIQVQATHKAMGVIAILYDCRQKPLYKRIIPVPLHPNDTTFIRWNLGWD